MNRPGAGAMTTQADRYREHAGRLLASLALLRNDEAYCDVLLRVEDAPSYAPGVWAHRTVLAAASPLFYNMFYASMDKCEKQIIILKEVDLETLQELITNVYLPTSLNVSVEKAKNLLVAAKLLEVADVYDAACSCLIQALAANNALGILAFAEMHACDALLAEATIHIYEHMEHVLQSDEFLTLTHSTLSALLEIERLAANEEHVFDAVLRWTLHHPQERKRHLLSLLQAVRLRLVPRQILVQRASVEPLASERQPLLQIIEALSTDHAQPEHHLPSATGTWSHNVQPALLVIGGKTSTFKNEITLVCTLPRGHWRSAATLPEPRIYAGAAVLDSQVYLVGGVNSFRFPADTIYVYNVATNSWTLGPRINKGRSNLGVTALDGRLYMIGGWDGLSSLESAQALDPREGVWQSIASMANSRRNHGVAVLDGKLYAVGGYDGKTELNSTERYDPVADKWQTMGSMAERRESLGVAVANDTLYAVGGWNGSNRLRSMERYCAGYWKFAPSMALERNEAAVTAYGSRLYVVGGYDDGLNCQARISVFDTMTSEWSEMPTLVRGLAAAAAVVVPWSPMPAVPTNHDHDHRSNKTQYVVTLDTKKCIIS